jgi:hypothetical protein
VAISSRFRRASRPAAQAAGDHTEWPKVKNAVNRFSRASTRKRTRESGRRGLSRVRPTSLISRRQPSWPGWQANRLPDAEANMRKDVREFIRRLEAVGLTVESTPGITASCARASRFASRTGCRSRCRSPRHDPLAQRGDRRAAQARHRPLVRGQKCRSRRALGHRASTAIRSYRLSELSRSRSRVRVLSLPLLAVPANRGKLDPTGLAARPPHEHGRAAKQTGATA